MGIAMQRLQAKRGQYMGTDAHKKASSEDTIKVKGYTRADGSKVPAYERAAPPPGQEKRFENLSDELWQPLSLKKKRKMAEPDTVSGYQKMFNSVDENLWGAADVSLSVSMPDGRRVWLYGDTMSKKNGFVHSTAMVQDGGKLHVSNSGKQLLPNGVSKEAGRKSIYWIERARSIGGNKIEITAGEQSVGNANVWDFRRVDENKSRVAIATVDKQGNVHFKKWKGYTARPTMSGDGDDWEQGPGGPNHVTYATVVHDIKLKNGKWLKTRCQNWDDPISNHVDSKGNFKFEDFRPLISEATSQERLQWKRLNP